MTLLMREVNYSKFQRWTFLPSTLSSWLCLQLFLHLVFIQSGMLVVVMGLRLENISVPQSASKGSTIWLSCDYRLDGDGEKLYSLKWYKDSHEFFRYMPSGPIPTQTFDLPGVHVEASDYTLKNANRVVFKMKNLRLSSGGTYKCEISADAPTFKTLSKESNLSVIVTPNTPMPRLSNFPKEAHLGGRIRGNCTFPKAYPPAKLTFYVNGGKVEANNSYDIKVKSYEPRADGVIEEYNWSGGSSSLSGGSSNNGVRRQYQYEQQNQQMSSSSGGMSNSNNNNMQLGRNGGGAIGNGIVGGGGSSVENTYTSVTGIDFRLDGQPFLQQREQLLTIRCVATLVDKAWEAQTNITIQSYQPPRLSSTGQNRYASGSVLPNFASQTARLGLLAITWIFLIC